jgi:demethylmenaquinone methyltransferase/2-methoxy-6-polyprenyl-1,4-benzoquinol methylase
LTLRSSLATPEGKRRYVRRLFATIADRYDFITIALSYGQDRRWKRRLIALAQLGPADRVLDLACGTGDLLFAAAERARSAVGLDITFRMLQLARGKRSVPVVAGDMLALPFPAASFTVVTTGYGTYRTLRRPSPRSGACSHRAAACSRSTSTGRQTQLCAVRISRT